MDKIGPERMRRRQLALYRCYLKQDRSPADPAFIQALAHLQWGWKHNVRIGSSGRYERRGWQALMCTVLRLPTPPTVKK
jgi:hypothetical protein